MPTIKSYLKRLDLLRAEYTTFRPLHRELSDYHLAHRGRFLVSDRNKGHKRNTKQINNTSRLAARTLPSGMMSGITSPARPWFRLGSGDTELDDIASVKLWLHEVQTIMYKIFSASNLYNSLHQIYSELGVFGTAAMGIFKDFDNVIWCRPYTIGSYYLGLNGKNESDSLYREYQLTVGQVVKQFTLANCSNSVKKNWDDGNTETWVDIVHVMEPNDDRDMASPLASDKAFRSVYFEKDNHSEEGEDKFLRQSGFDDFPILPPRWDVTGEDTYATDCPGITALGDTKALQLAEKRKYQAIDKMVLPPLQGPSTLKSKLKGRAPHPGETVFFDNVKGEGLKSIYQNYKPDIKEIKEEILNVEDRIQRSFYEDLFLMLANSDRRQVTAREVAEKHEEKLLMLGPVLERLHTELLDPLIDRTFNIAQRHGIFPPPPPELNQTELAVEYVSVLAQAQRLVNTGAIDRISEYTGSVAAVWPEARHKININRAIDEYGEALGIDPSIIVSDEQALAAAEAEAQAAQAAQMMAQAEQAANIAKTASETTMTDEETVLGGAVSASGFN